jgi:putative ABC transport system permease protein
MIRPTPSTVIGDALRQQRLSAVLIAGFALGALVLAAMGLFEVVAGSVLRPVLNEAAALVGVGLLIGVPGVYFAGRLVRGVLVGVSPSAAPTLLAVALALAVVAMTACYVPVRRVLAIDPAQSLRQE